MFVFNKEYLEFKDSIEELVNKYIEQGANERNFNKVYPAEIMKNLGKLGYNGLLIPMEYEGANLDIVSSMIVINTVAKSDASIAQLLSAGNFGFVYPLLAYGTEEQKQKYLVPIAIGEKETSFAYIESQSGIHTTARQEGEYFILNGSKVMSTNSPYADYCLVIAIDNEAVDDVERLSAFIVDLKNTDGVVVDKPEETMGLQSLRIAGIHFDDVKVPKSDLLGSINQGPEIRAKLTSLACISNCAIALGVAERAYEEALEYAKIRIIDSAPLIEMQYVRFDFADIKAELELMRLATFYVASRFGQEGWDELLNGCIIKYKITEKAKSICDQCLKIFGGSGYIRGNIVERLYRDIRALTILGGPTNSLQGCISMFI